MKKISLTTFLFIILRFQLASGARARDTRLLRPQNSRGMTATFTAYGARLVSLWVPARSGKRTNLVWGFDNSAEYRACKTDPYYGAIIGRYGNRIGKGKFSLDGKMYKLDLNDGLNSLHGGKDGFNTWEWQAQQLNESRLVFTYLSKDGEGGYPGNLKVKVTYTLTEDNGLQITYEATTDKATFINLTNHAFWNLNGVGNGNILRHEVRIRADAFTPVDSTLIPTGRIKSVEGTPFGFRNSRPIGVRINDHNEQLHNGKGYDHNFVLSQHGKQTPVAEVWGDISGIHMKVYSDQPGPQFYSGNFMAGKNTMQGGFKDNYRNGFCLETQHFPDSLNEPQFPSTVLRPGAVYNRWTVYKFSTD